MDVRHTGPAHRLRNVRRRVKAAVLQCISPVLRRRRDLVAPCSDPRRILVNGLMGVGNMILFTPALQAIRQRFPDAEIVLLGSPGAVEVLRGGTIVDRLLTLEPGPLAFLTTVRNLRRRRFDLLVSSFHGAEHPTITALSGIPRRVGHATSPGWPSPFDGLLDEKVLMEEDQHEIDRGLALARTLGPDVAGFRAVFVLRDVDRGRADAFLRAHGVPSGAHLIGVQADCWRDHPFKRWSTRKLAGVCDTLLDRGATVVILGSPGHDDERDALLGAMSRTPVVAMGEVDLKAAAAVLERCTLAITNDSGLMHVAAVVGTPVVAVYGPTDPRRTSPHAYGGRHVLVREDVTCSPCFRMEGDAVARACRERICLDRITVEDVLEAVDRIEDRERPPPGPPRRVGPGPRSAPGK